MILTSLRCYLNCLVPMTDKDILLRSTYYMIDIDVATADRGGDVVFSTDGALERVEKMNNNYRVFSCHQLNPIPHTSDIGCIDMPGGPTIKNKQKLYLDHLMNSNTRVKVFNDLFNTNKRTDYPIILIMYDEHTTVDFGHMIAMYLSNVFGEDIDFLDPTLRADVPGNRDGKYVGNKQQGYLTRKQCKHDKLMNDLRYMLDEHSRESTISNYTNLFAGYTVQDLIEIYNQLFPEKPLQFGYYTYEDMLNILLGTMMKEVDFKSSSTDEDYRERIGEYEQELSDWEQLQESFRTEMLYGEG